MAPVFEDMKTATWTADTREVRQRLEQNLEADWMNSPYAVLQSDLEGSSGPDAKKKAEADSIEAMKKLKD